MAIKLINSQKEIMRKIIYAVETGGQIYGNQRYDDFTPAATNTDNEKAITIGAGQWYATEAQRLLRRIRMADETLFNQLDTSGIGNDIDSANWSKYDIAETSAKAKCIIKIISTNVGIECQNKLMDEQIEEFEKEIVSLGVTDIKAIMMCINIRHLGGLSAVKRILRKANKPYTLDSIYQSLKSDQQDYSSNNQVGDKLYWSRQEKVYRWIDEKVVIENDDKNSTNKGGNQMGTLNGLINRALSEVGYLEKRSNSNLYSKTENAGSANYTKYGKEMHDLYPSVMDFPAAWCDAFVDWLFYKEFGVTNAKGLLGGNFNDYTVGSAQLYKNKGAWYTSNPKVGDQIFFKNSSRICHTGLVIEVTPTHVITIEGNTSGASGVISNGGGVCKKKYSLSYSHIAGYGRPAYSKFATTNDISSVTSWKATGTATCTGNDVAFRATPNGTELGSLNKGNRFEVDGTKSGEWVHAKVAGIGIGYIHGNYVKYDTVDAPDIITPVIPFADVYKTDYYYDAVKWAVEKNIAKGKTSAKFMPSNNCTRSEAVTFIWRFYGCPEPTITANPFTDVGANTYYNKAVLWAVENGITTGVTKTKFKPWDMITRGQFITLLWRANGKSIVVMDNPFSDLDRNAYYYDAVLWAVKNKITTGYKDDVFAPEMACSRGQAVTLLYRSK